MNNPWRSIKTPPEDGAVCDIQYYSLGSCYDMTAGYFLHDDGYWYQIEPPLQMRKGPIAWRYHLQPVDAQGDGV